MKSFAQKFASSLAVLLSTLLILFVLDQISAYMSKRNVFRSYHSLEEAEAALNSKILVPSYYPEMSLWPPRQVKIEQSGGTAEVWLEFRSDNKTAYLETRELLDVPYQATLLELPFEKRKKLLSEGEENLYGWPAQWFVFEQGSKQSYELRFWYKNNVVMMNSNYPIPLLIQMAKSMVKEKR